MIRKEKLKCPFCQTVQYNSNHPEFGFQCGTKGPDEEGNYTTGEECDKICFRNGFLRCHDLLVLIADRSTEMYPEGCSDFVVPREVMEKVFQEVREDIY